MKILHLASFDRWSGAAAPAFAETEALREAGVEAFYCFTAGNKLEIKLESTDYAFPALHRGQTPRAVIRSVASVRRLVETLSIDVLHPHLGHDHWLAYMTRRSFPHLKIVRTFHSRHAVRRDILFRHLLGDTDAVAAVNPLIAEHPLLAARNPVVTPPPIVPMFTPAGDDVRERYDIPDEAPVLGVIGKMTRDRGFQDAIRTFALVRSRFPDARLLVIGRGPYRSELEQLAAALGIESSVIFAGYHETSLPDHFRTIDVLLFTVGGSDEGHRATIEAMACGALPACWPIPALDYILGECSEELIVAEPTHELLAERASLLLKGPSPALQEAARRNVARFTYDQTVKRLRELYAKLS